MLDALRFETMRLRTLRSTYWMIGSGLVTAAVLPIIFGFSESDSPLSPENAAIGLNGGAEFALPFVAVFMAIVGIFSTGHEYRHGTIQPTLTALPQRSRLILAKMLTVAILTVAVTVVSMAINAGILLAFWGEIPNVFADPMFPAMLGYIVYTLIYALSGLGLGLLFRGVPSALVVIFLVPLIFEPVVLGLSFIPALDWLVPVVKFLPYGAGSLLLTIGAPDLGPGAPDFDFFSRWASGGVFAIYAALIIGAAWYLFKRRDA